MSLVTKPLGRSRARCLRRSFQTNSWPKTFALVQCLETWQHYLGSHKAKAYTDNMFLKYFETQTQVSTKPLRWHDTLALIKVNLIHNLEHGNVVSDALSRREEFQAMRTIQTLWLIFIGERNLWCKIQEGDINYPELQRFQGEFCKSKVLTKGKLVDRLFKYKQSRVHVP